MTIRSDAAILSSPQEVGLITRWPTLGQEGYGEDRLKRVGLLIHAPTGKSLPSAQENHMFKSQSLGP